MRSISAERVQRSRAWAKTRRLSERCCSVSQSTKPPNFQLEIFAGVIPGWPSSGFIVFIFRSITKGPRNLSRLTRVTRLTHLRYLTRLTHLEQLFWRDWHGF